MANRACSNDIGLFMPSTTHAGSFRKRTMRVPAQRIFPRRYRLQVCRIHAATVAAQVVKLQSIWDWASEMLKRQPMGIQDFLWRNRQAAVSALIQIPDPRPTTVVSAVTDFRHESRQHLLVHHKPALSAAHARLENREHDEPATLRLRAWAALKVGCDTVCSFAGFEASVAILQRYQPNSNRRILTRQLCLQ